MSHEDSESGSSSRNKLRTINGKVVRSRGREDGSMSRMYPGDIRPIGFDVSYDPIDGETMLGIHNSMGLSKHAWTIGITPEDCIIHAQSQSEISLTHSQPVESQEPKPVHQDEEPTFRRRSSERIKQLIFNKPPSHGPGLDLDDAILVE
nr:hypothetical protein [Tanacetum cinerariifolium]GEZ31051.1 hypothetical protein [Tanacetum cinerariifolium]